MPEFETALWALGAAALLGYGLGSLPFGMLFARLWGLGDLRKQGSGNIGATNVLRTGSKVAAALTLVFDAAKGAGPVILARSLWGEDAAQVAGLMAFLGHCFPIWLGFRGGKGVATFLGVLLALVWPVGIAACAVWLLTAWVTRVSSLSALVAAAAAPAVMWGMNKETCVVLAALLAALIFLRHRSNVIRLIQGAEPKIGSGR